MTWQERRRPEHLTQTPAQESLGREKSNTGGEPSKTHSRALPRRDGWSPKPARARGKGQCSAHGEGRWASLLWRWAEAVGTQHRDCTAWAAVARMERSVAMASLRSGTPNLGVLLRSPCTRSMAAWFFIGILQKWNHRGNRPLICTPDF